MTINESDLQTFLAMSVVFTDFSEFQLRGTGQAELYFSTAADIVGEETMGELLSAFLRVSEGSKGSPASLHRRLRAEVLSDDKLGPVARNIIKLWYIGTWYQLPRAWRERFGVVAGDRDFVPSPSSYVEGLLWPAIGSHPPGAKAPGYGTWTEAPDIPTGLTAAPEDDPETGRRES